MTKRPPKALYDGAVVEVEVFIDSDRDAIISDFPLEEKQGNKCHDKGYEVSGHK